MSDKVKLLVVIGQLEVGGTERHLLNVLPAIQSDDIGCTIYALRGGGELEDLIRSAGISVVSPEHYSRRWFGLARTALHFMRTVRAQRPDILHFFLPEAYLLGGVCSLFLPRCIRVMSRRSLNRYQRKWFLSGYVERFLHGRLRCALANSDAVLAELHKEGIADRRSATIYNGVRIPTEAESQNVVRIRETLDLPSDAIVLVMVANLIPYKGHTDLIEAIHLAKIRMPRHWVVLMIGADTGIRVELERLVAVAGLAEHIRWLGAVEDIRPYLSLADIALNTSHEEGFSNAILEAMAASLPLIVTDVGGNAEAVVDGESGCVVPVKNATILASAIVDLTGNEAKRKRLGQAARTRVESRFALAECIASYRRLYLALGRGSSRPITEILRSAT